MDGDVFTHVSYGLGEWAYTFDAPDSAVRVWELPPDWGPVEWVALMIVDDETRLEVLSELLEISSN